LQYFKVAVWEDTQAQNLQSKLIFITLKIAFKMRFLTTFREAHFLKDQ